MSRDLKSAMSVLTNEGQSHKASSLLSIFILRDDGDKGTEDDYEMNRQHKDPAFMAIHGGRADSLYSSPQLHNNHTPDSFSSGWADLIMTIYNNNNSNTVYIRSLNQNLLIERHKIIYL